MASVLLYGVLAAVLYLLYDFYTHGTFYLYIIPKMSSYFFYHPEVGKFLGVKYYKSDEWATTRNETSLAVGQDVASLFGIKYQFGTISPSCCIVTPF